MTEEELELGRRIDGAMRDIKDELEQAMEIFPAFSSAHEGYAMILEQMDQLWVDIKDLSTSKWIYVKSDALQVAAMAIRFLVDLEGKYLDKK